MDGADRSGSHGRSAEERLASLVAAAGPARRVLAAIAGRMVTTRGWERLCYARLSDYARERAGVSGRQLQELARVDAALVRLPGLERALVANVLPWSKVRLVARVASDDDVVAWIERAAAGTVRELERAVKDARAAEDAGGEEGAAEEEPTRRVVLRCSPAVREKWNDVRELAERVAGRRLAAAEALECVVSEALSALAVAPDEEESARPSRRAPEPAPDAAAGARAPARILPAEIAALARGLELADARELDRRLRAAVHFEQTLDSAIGPLLRVVTAADHEWHRGPWQPLARYASEQLGMSARKARALLRLERAGDVCPELREAYRRGRLSWEKAQCLLPLLLLDLDGAWRPVWVAWAERVTLRRLEKDVERALLLRAGTHLAWHRCKHDPARAQDPLPEDERQMCAHDVDPEATERLAWRVPRTVAALFAAVREAVRARITAQRGRDALDGEVFEALLDHAAACWTLREPGTRRPDPVIERDGWLCAVPGCTSRSSLHDHHIVFRSAGGSDEAWNRITLCAFHHQRGVHAGRMQIRGRAPDGLVFSLPLAAYASGDVLLPTRSALPAPAGGDRRACPRAA